MSQVESRPIVRSPASGNALVVTMPSTLIIAHKRGASTATLAVSVRCCRNRQGFEPTDSPRIILVEDDVLWPKFAQ